MATNPKPTDERKDEPAVRPAPAATIPADRDPEVIKAEQEEQRETQQAQSQRLREAGFKETQEYNAQLQRERLASVADAGEKPMPHFLGSPPDAAPPPVPTGTLAAADIPPPRSPQWAQSGSYIYTAKDIFASTAIPAAVMSYVLDRTYITADAQGKRTAIEGTVLALYPAKGVGYMKLKQSGETAAGVLHGRYDLSDVDADVAVIVGNAWLRRDKMIDEGTYGTVLAQSATDLAVRNIVLTTYDV